MQRRLAGKNFDFDDVGAMRARFPRLLARLPTCGGVDDSVVPPERKVAFLGDWHDERLHAALHAIIGTPIRGSDPMASASLSVRRGNEVVEIDYTPIMGVFAKGPPGAVDALATEVAETVMKLH